MTPTCRLIDGGEPRCRLGYCENTTIEVKGNNFASVLRYQEYGQRSNTPALGPNQYDVMIIGEAPGIEEDKSGVPFQGQVGELLTRFLATSGLDLTRVYLTYITKCRPPKGRKASMEELKACRPFLLTEIQLLQPKVIMLLGASSLRLFNLHNEGGVTSVRGKVFKKTLPGWEQSPEFYVIPSVNPATFLYHDDKSAMRQVAGDYKLAASVLKDSTLQGREKFTNANYSVVRTKEEFEWLFNELKAAPMFAFDTESTGLPYTKHPMLCMSFCWGYNEGRTTTAVLPFYTHDPNGSVFKISKLQTHIYAARLYELFTDPEKEIAAHNIKYDANAINYHFGLKIAGTWWDTMVMHHLLNEKRPHDLEYLADMEFGYGDYSFDKREIVGHGRVLRCGYDHIPDNILHPYAATDAEACYRLYNLYKSRFTPRFFQFYKEECDPLMKELAIAERNGVLVDTNVVSELKKEFEESQENLLKEIKKKVISVIPKANSPADEDTYKSLYDFNPLSPAQLKTVGILMGHKDKLIKKDSPSGYSTNKNTLLELAEEDPFFGHIVKYRNGQKLIGTYLENVLNDLDADGKIRYGWLLHGTETGRLSNRFFHQMPGVDETRKEQGKHNLRDMLIASAGAKFVYADFSQVELRILAILAQDKEMQRIFEDPDADIHQATAAEILGLPEDGSVGRVFIPTYKGGYYVEAQVNKPNRKEIGKRVNFGLAYGSEGYNLVHTGKWYDINGQEHPLTWDMLTLGMRRWKRRFSGVSNFIDTIAEETRLNRGVIANVFGRERRFGGRLNDLNEGVRKAAQRELVNFPIQSTAGSLTNRTIVEIGRVLDKYSLRDKIWLVNTVHDSMMYEVKDELVDWFAKTIKIVGSRPIPELFNNSFPVDVGIGINWTKAEE